MVRARSHSPCTVLQDFAEVVPSAVGHRVTLNSGNIGAVQGSGLCLPRVPEGSGADCRGFARSGCGVVPSVLHLAVRLVSLPAVGPWHLVSSAAPLPSQNDLGGVSELQSCKPGPLLHFVLDVVYSVIDGLFKRDCAHLVNQPSLRRDRRCNVRALRGLASPEQGSVALPLIPAHPSPLRGLWCLAEQWCG